MRMVFSSMSSWIISSGVLIYFRASKELFVADHIHCDSDYCTYLLAEECLHSKRVGGFGYIPCMTNLQSLESETSRAEAAISQTERASMLLSLEDHKDTRLTQEKVRHRVCFSAGAFFA